MQMQEILAKMALEQLERQARAQLWNEQRYGWMKHRRNPGSRAHRAWARRRASGRA